MTPEQRFLLRALSDHIHGKKTMMPDGPFDVERFEKMVCDHSLGGLFYPLVRHWPRQEKWDRLRESLHREFLGDVFFSINRADLLREIAERFREKDIPFICMKGAVYRDCYPVPELRSMGDIDIVIRPGDREKADRIMMDEMGCERMIDHQAVWTYWIDKLMIEIHDHMFYEELASPFDYQSYFDHVWDHCQHAPVFGITSDNLYAPEVSFHFLYLMTHTAKHIINNGSGLRSYLDMVFLCQRYKGINWKYVEEELSRLRLLSFTRTCMTLCERWFGVEMPLSLGKIDEDFYRSVTEKTFADGVFGLDNADNRPAKAAKEIKRSSLSYYPAAFKRNLRLLFPPYEDMQLIPWYSFVDGRPWLMPAAWIYRLFYCLIKKRKHGGGLLTEPFLREKEVKERQIYLKKWGL